MYANLNEGYSGRSYETGERLSGFFVAIAQYENDLHRAYLFLVSENFEVIGDFLYDSIKEAQMGDYYGSIKGNWISCEPSTQVN